MGRIKQNKTVIFKLLGSVVVFVGFVVVVAISFVKHFHKESYTYITFRRQFPLSLFV